MPRTDLKKEDEYWVASYGDSDFDDADEFFGGAKVNGFSKRVHASDVEVECDEWDEDLNFGTNKMQHKAFNEDEHIKDESYMVDQDGDNHWSGYLDDMRRWR